ncbi:major facilitator superfamily domain-containing protein [Aspergillus oleicola]
MDSQQKHDNKGLYSEPQRCQDSSNHLYGLKLYSILFGVMIATLLISLDTSIIATAIPSITSQFNPPGDIVWYGAAYPLTMSALQPLSGKIATIFSLRITYLTFFAIFLLGSLLCGVANTSNMFIIGRAVAGIGGAGVVPGGLLVVAIFTPPTQRPLFTGLLTSLYAVGAVIAPIVGGALKATILKKLQQLDLVGCALFVPSIVMVLLALQWGGKEYPWKSATVIGLFCGFGGLMGIFVSWEVYKDEEAMIPFQLLKDRSVVLAIIFAFLFMGSLIVPVYYLPEWFQVVGDATKHIKYYNPFFLLGSTMLCIASGLYTTFTPTSTPAGKWIGFQIIQGLGCGIGAQMTFLTVQNALQSRSEVIPAGISTVLFAQYFGSSVVQAIAGSIFHNELLHELRSGLGLNETDVGVLLSAGNLDVREAAGRVVPNPDGVDQVIGAYNGAITAVFYVAVAASALALVLSLGMKWTDITQDASDLSVANDDEAEKYPSGISSEP